jgi:hypothetical protein
VSASELAQAPILSCMPVPNVPSGCQAVRQRSSIIRDTAETHASPPERALSGCRHVSNSKAWYSMPPDRNESLQRGHVRLCCQHESTTTSIALDCSHI